MKNSPRKESITHFMGQVEIYKKCAIQLDSIEYILRQAQPLEPETKQAFREIHSIIFRQLSTAYETLFAWALLQPDDILGEAKVEAEQRWGKTFADLVKKYGWEKD